MGLLSVDQEKCKRDSICAAVCPAGIIVFKNKEAFPTMIEGGDELCIRCGHCVAVCPHGAMSHEAMSTTECPTVRAELNLQPDQVEQFLMAEALDLPEGHVSFGAMMVGQPKFKYPRMPLRNDLKTTWR